MAFNIFPLQLFYFITYFIILLSNVKIINSLSCSKNDLFSNSNCFNDILAFNDAKYRAGHSSTNKDGVFIIEFSVDSESGNRLFYGLKSNGRYYFSDESPTKSIVLTKREGSERIARYESINAFVYLTDDMTSQYFLSISTYYCLIEIYDFENSQWDSIYTGDYLGNQVFSFKFEIHETQITGKPVYYLIYSKGQSTGEEVSIQKIEFSGLNFNTGDIKATKPISNKLNDRLVSAFIVDDIDDNDYKVLVVIYLKNSSPSKYLFSVYSLSDLSAKCSNVQLYSDDLSTGGRGDLGKGYGLFFKIIYLGDKDSAMAYFLENYDDKILRFQVLTIVKTSNSYAFDSKIYMEMSETLKTDLLLNDMIQFADSRLALISTKGSTTLLILLIDLYNNNKNVQMRTYQYTTSPYTMTKELSAHLYNNYLAFSSTVTTNEISSIFMIFGFGNGTDFTIDISIYLMDTGEYNSDNNLVDKLLENLSIDNNIFGYIPVEKLILVSYPEELLIYNEDDENTLIEPGSIIDNTIIIKQNLLLNKTHKYYYIEYQYMVKEPEYSEYKKYANNIYDKKETNNYDNYEDSYSPKTFYGRTNKLAFKLCHDYCETCNILGMSNNYQKCFTCLPEYTYDYLTIINKFTENCVPYDYLYDDENNELKLCNSTKYKFYYNNSRNHEKYCFTYSYDCPEEYNYFNEIYI